jgi:hypothetical protein
VGSNTAWGPNNRRSVGANSRAWGANNRLLGAPFASGDGKVTIYALDDILADGGEASLQALATLRNLPPWLRNVGPGYRLISDATATRTLAFQYLEHEVPKGYEQTLTVYYQAANDQDWQRLPTYLDTDENLAAARMPQNAVRGQGIYALMATVELPQIYAGWNLLAYTIPGSRLVADALASLEGAYTSVYAHDAASPDLWRLYDATVIKQHPDFAAQVNDLTALEFGHAYWLYATQAITPYLGVGTPSTASISAAALTDASELPPATFYGPINTAGLVTPSLGMPVTASISGEVCGRGQVASLNGQWIYKIQVAAASQNNGCGTPGAIVNFTLGSQTTAEAIIWDNRQAQYQPLTAAPVPSPFNDATDTVPSLQNYRFFFPIIGK